MSIQDSYCHIFQTEIANEHSTPLDNPVYDTGSPPGALETERDLDNPIYGLQDEGEAAEETYGRLEDANVGTPEIPGDTYGRLEDATHEIPGDTYGRLEDATHEIPGDTYGRLEDATHEIPGDTYGRLEDANVGTHEMPEDMNRAGIYDMPEDID